MKFQVMVEQLIFQVKISPLHLIKLQQLLLLQLHQLLYPKLHQKFKLQSLQALALRLKMPV